MCVRPSVRNDKEGLLYKIGVAASLTFRGALPKGKRREKKILKNYTNIFVKLKKKENSMGSVDKNTLLYTSYQRASSMQLT